MYAYKMKINVIYNRWNSIFVEIKILINIVQVLNTLYILGRCIIFAFIYFSSVHEHVQHNNYYAE